MADDSMRELDGAGETPPVDGFPVGFPRLDGERETTDGDAGLLRREDALASDGDLATPTPLPFSTLAPGAKGRKRTLAVRLAPTSVIPLVLLIWFVYWLATGGLAEPEAASLVTPSPSPSSADATPIAVSQQTVEALPAATPSPVEFEGLLARAADLVQHSKFEGAIAIYRDLASSAPADARPETGWAQALLLDSLPDQALPHAQQAIALDPTDAEAMAVLAQATLETGDVARALIAALGAVQLDDNSAAAHAVLAEAYLLDGQFQKAASEVDRALALDASNAAAHQVRSELDYIVENDVQEAIAELQTAAELQPGLWLRHYQLGLLLLDAGEPNPAIVALTDALVLRHKPLTFTTLGQAYYRSGQLEQARSFLEQSLSAGATDPTTYALLAAINVHDGRCNDARIYFDQALTQDPANALALEARNTCQGTLSKPTSTSVAGSTPTKATPSLPSPPPLSGQIAFPVWNAETGQYDTYVAEVDGSERHLVAEEMHQPAFRADGQWLAVNGERSDAMNLVIVRLDGSDLKEVTAYLEDSLPCWSPNGQSLVFSSTRHKDRRPRLYIVDQVAFDGSSVQDRVLNSDLYELLGEYPAWMPEGRIVYAGCDYTATPTRCGLFAISAEQGPQTPEQLTTQPGDTAPAAMAGRVAFMSDRDGNWEIYVVNADGSGLKRLTDNGFNDGLPTWSPDGQAIAFVSDEGGVWAVWAMSADGSNRRKLFDIGGGGLASDWQHERIAWGP